MRCFSINLKDEYKFLGDNGRNATLICYLPYCLKEMGRADEKRPSIIIIPGGGYGMCSEREAEPIALKFLNWGFNTFILRYSVAPNRFPSQLLEVAAVFEEIYKNAVEWNCDTNKIGMIGFSAGGHLVSHYSNLYNCDEVRELFCNSKKPNFNILCYPVITTDESFSHKGSIANLLGEYRNDERFSCEKLVTAKTPPTFIWHTAQDQIVDVKNSICYANALAENNVNFSFHVYPYGEHGLATCDNLTINYENINEKINIAANWILDFKKWIDTVI